MPVFDISAKFSPNRDDTILRWSAGRKVLHIGACDAPNTLKKHKRGLLLHARLAMVASDLRGIDLDRDAIRLMAELGYPIDYVDMNNVDTLDFRPEVIVFGETIEHLTNFDSTFACLKRIMGPATRLIISTPNAFYSLRFFQALRGHEHTHPEHTCLFSLQVIRQLLDRYDLECDEVLYTFLPRRKHPPGRRFARTLARVAPALAETLLLSVRRRPDLR